MKYTVETEIDAPIETVAELVGDPGNRKEWMEGLESDEHVSGTPGMPGAKSRLVFETGHTTVTMDGTVISRDLPDGFSQTMEAPHVSIAITTRLVALSPQKTRHVSEQEYEFHGLKNKIIGTVMRRTFEKQTRRHVENFKQLAETET